MTFIQSLPTLAQSIGCFDRIQEYCLLERSRDFLLAQTDSLPMDDNIELSRVSMAVKSPITTIPCNKFLSFQNASISWTAESTPVLHDLTLSIPTGKIIMVMGSVGCGKSTLLETIMGQTQIASGTMHLAPANIAYCPQSPWIMNASIQDNITGWTALDQKWYDASIVACGLADDINKFPKGSMHMAGSGGISLSGGQKQRVVRGTSAHIFPQTKQVLIESRLLRAQSTLVSQMWFWMTHSVD